MEGGTRLGSSGRLLSNQKSSLHSGNISRVLYLCVCVCVAVGEGGAGEKERVIGDLILSARWRGDKGFLDRGDSRCKSTEA